MRRPVITKERLSSAEDRGSAFFALYVGKMQKGTHLLDNTQGGQRREGLQGTLLSEKGRQSELITQHGSLFSRQWGGGGQWGGCLRQTVQQVQRPGGPKALTWSGNTWQCSHR